MTKNSPSFAASTVSFSTLSATVAVLAGFLSTGCVADAVVESTSAQTMDASAIAPKAAPVKEAVTATETAPIINTDTPAVTDEPAANTQSVAVEWEDEIDPSDAYVSEDGRVDAQGNLLPEIIDDLTVGMPYDEARELIVINGIWLPRTYPPVDTNNVGVVALQEMGFEEARECSGTGLGLCRLEFVEPEGLLFGVIVTTSEEMPMVWSWFVE